MRRLSLVIVFLFVGSTSLIMAGENPVGWQAGAAKVKITPKAKMWMSGYASRNKPAQGKINDLWAKALVLQDPTGNKAVVITLDLVGITRNISNQVCQTLAKKHKIPRSNVVLSISHTHSGPVIRENLESMYNLSKQQGQFVRDYTKSLIRDIGKVTDKAMSNLKSAKLSWAIGKATFAVNRRNNKEADVPKLRMQEIPLNGPIDHDVPILAVRDLKGNLTAVLFGYACHATVLSGYEWCGDYPGFAQTAVEEANPGAVALFWAGCGGDQNPLPRRKVSLAKKYGDELAASVQTVLKKPMKNISGKIHTAFREVDLPFSELPTREQLVKDTMSDNKYIISRAKSLLAKLNKDGELRGTYPYPIQVWQMGKDVTLVTLGGEVVVDYALRIKKEVGAKTFVMGYANDVMAYIPSLRVLKEGGYEGARSMIYYGQPTVWSPRVEEMIMTTVNKLVQSVRK